MIFTRGLVIESQSGPQVFENCMAKHQLDCFTDIAPSLTALRKGDMPEFKRYWIERTKKASKDADLAVMTLWLAAFPLRPFLGQIGAADQSQAGIVKERVTHLLHLNPWLNDYVKLVNNKIFSTKMMANGRDPMCKFDIMSSDAAGAHGGTPDLLIVNELSHISRWEFAENLMSNAAGVAQGMAIIATNAGIKGSKAEVWRINAMRPTSGWRVWVLARPAPWTNKQTLKDEKGNLSPSKYMRLWWGRWASGKGDALSEEAIDACFVLQGPLLGPEKGWVYFGGLDLGITHDHAGLVVVGVQLQLRQIKLGFMRAWEPVEIPGSPKKEVQLTEVEKGCVSIHKLFTLMQLGYDPHEARLMSQQMRKVSIPVREVTFTPGNLSAMASALIQVMTQRMLMCYDDVDGRLRRDLGKFNIVEKPYGYKLEAVSDEFGHADVGTALVIALMLAMEYLEGMLEGLSEDDVLVDDNEEDLTEEEVADMPDVLREIYGTEGVPKHTSPVQRFLDSRASATERGGKKKFSDPFADLE